MDDQDDQDDRDGHDERLDADRPASELDDVADRDELRRRYYGLMQELRVLLPGVQILVAFLLTAPFAQRFPRLDDTGRVLYAIALGAGTASVLAFVTPAVIHRVGDRRSRSARLERSVQLCRLGLACMGLALVASLMVVARLVFSEVASYAFGGGVLAAMLVFWVVIPVRTGRPRISAPTA